MPTTTPIGFVLAGNRLVTIRYATPKPVRTFENHARRDPELVRDGPTALVRLLDAIIDRLADEIERVSATMEELSQEIFQEQPGGAADSGREADRAADQHRQSRRHCSRRSATRRSATLRMLSFFGGSNRVHEEDQTRAPAPRREPDDRRHLTERACELPVDNLTFLLDASLGLISIEQNAAMKLFSWAAVVFLPPTLIAGIFGMNFHYMPELSWRYGYPTLARADARDRGRALSLFQEARLDLGESRRRNRSRSLLRHRPPPGAAQARHRRAQARRRPRLPRRGPWRDAAARASAARAAEIVAVVVSCNFPFSAAPI